MNIPEWKPVKRRAKKKPTPAAVKKTAAYKNRRAKNNSAARDWRARKRKEKRQRDARLAATLARRRELLGMVAVCEATLEDLQDLNTRLLLEGDFTGLGGLT